MVREVPLGDRGPPTYDVRYHKRFIDELGEFEHPEATLAEIEESLGIDPASPPHGTTEKVEGSKRLRRYKPQINPRIRIFYGVEERTVNVVSVHLREHAYQPKNIRTSEARVAGMGPSGSGPA